jgi:3-mercaptopyruvate sulfurtransferase SseA
MIMYCRSGKRSASAIELARKKGYKKYKTTVPTFVLDSPTETSLLFFFLLFRSLRNYTGSWLDWVSKQNERRAEEE